MNKKIIGIFMQFVFCHWQKIQFFGGQRVKENLYNDFHE